MPIKSSTLTSLSNLRALVTGATSGIGRAIALQLGRGGAHVIVHGRDAARGAAVVAEITTAGGRARFVGADLGDVADIRRLVREVGDLDVLVNNAGFAAFAPTAAMPVEQLDALYASNVRAPFLLVAGFAPAMAARGTGSVITIGSMAGAVGLAGGAAYGATKAAVAALTRAWTAEYSAQGVRFNTVAPGPVAPDGKATPDFITALGSTTAAKRPAAASEIAEVVAFLASPAASYVTGAVIPVDGGRTAI